MPKGHCRDCACWDPYLNPESGPAVGVCHFYPKSHKGSEAVNGRIAEADKYYWPEQEADDWCWQFQISE